MSKPISELAVLTAPFDPTTGLFDDAGLRRYLTDRELVRAVPQFVVHEGSPVWSVFVESRLLQGAGSRTAHSAPDLKPRETARATGDSDRDADRARADIRGRSQSLDEAQAALLNRLKDWRRRAAHSAGVPPYVILTNRVLLDLVEQRPHTNAGLLAIHGVGDKTVKRWGTSVLEVLRDERAERTGPPDSVREVDGDHGVADGPDPAVPQAAAPLADPAD